MFEQENPGVTRCPVEVRHPFFDLRVVEFPAGAAAVPIFFEKKLLREAMVGRLPESVRSRPKTSAGGRSARGAMLKSPSGNGWIK